MFLCFYVSVRIFLAIEIPKNTKEKLVEVQEELRPHLPDVRWEKPEKLHITLVFLGEVDGGRVRELGRVVEKGVKGIKPACWQGRGVKIGFSEIGTFPKHRPRVVLVEVGEGREEIERLQKRLAEALSEAGFDFARLSEPHVTLGRFQKGIKGVKEEKGVKGMEDIGGFRVREIAIVESKLHPAGAIHTPIVRVPLC